MIKSEKHEIVCVCRAPFHRVEFVHDTDPHDEQDFLYVQYQLLQYRSLWQRLIVAVKYVLGYPQRYGCWDVTEIDREQARALKDWLNTHL